MAQIERFKEFNSGNSTTAEKESPKQEDPKEATNVKNADSKNVFAEDDDDEESLPF